MPLSCTAGNPILNRSANRLAVMASLNVSKGEVCHMTYLMSRDLPCHMTHHKPHPFAVTVLCIGWHQSHSLTFMSHVTYVRMPPVVT